MPPEAEPARRRGQAVLDRILDTTLDLIASQGYAFSVDDVAGKAGVHKTTVYRRWGTKALLVASAIERLAAIEVPVTRTADAIDDLITLACSVARSLRSPAGAQAIRAVVAAAGEDPDLVDVARAFLTDRYRLAVPIIADAVAAGRIRAGVDPILLWQAIVNPLHMRAILGDPADDATAADLVQLVLAGSAA